ncbi:MAG: exo-alpha-sialidase, partial [Planctomycetota bacterium]
GESWSLEDPKGYVGDGGVRRDVPEGLDFKAPGFAMRVGAVGYLASEEKRGELFFSSDRGKTWIGPCGIAALLDHPELKDVVVTSRTDYLVNGKSECLLFCSARNSDKWKSDRAFCARSVDAAKTFQFVSWIVPPADLYRAVMPNTVRFSQDMLVSAIRRRPVSGPSQDCWIDTYVSKDNGNTWSMLSRAAETGIGNGNPPALTKLKDGRLCLVYGNRTKREMLARLSSDQGRTWGRQILLRDDYQTDSFNDADLGYPRVVQRADGKLVTMYYWATKQNPHHHIAGTIWNPDAIK